MVIVAFALFAIMAMATFAIDVSHWFDYSRNLQNRADAAALAAGSAYGNICFGTSAGDTQTGAQSAIGKWAQLYSGAGVGEPAGNLPYTDAEVSASPSTAAGTPPGPGTGWSVIVNGYINNTLPASTLNSPLTLKLGSLDDYLVRLNADDYAVNGGTNFAMGDFCSADTSKDKTDHTSPSHTGAMADVKVTQRNLPDFIPIFNVKPNISAHSRVEIEQVQSQQGVRPIAVGNASYTPCITANFLDKDGNLIASEKLTQKPNSTFWTSNPTAPDYPAADVAKADVKQIAMPGNGDPVTVQLSLNNCSTTDFQETKYDWYNDKGQEQTLGLVYINNYGNPTAPGATAPPAIAPGGVHLKGDNGGTCDPYYNESSSDCSVSVDAQVSFQAGVDLSSEAFVRAVISGIGPLTLTHGTGTDWSSEFNPDPPGDPTTFTLPADSGPHTVTLQWAQTSGIVNGNTCNLPGNGDPFSNANPCHGTFPGPTVGGAPNVQQRAFAGINGTNACDNPTYETGPIQWIAIGTTDSPGATAGANAYGTTASSPHLYVSTQIEGLHNSGDTDPNVCLRVAEQTQHGTGFVDCGQGNGTGQVGGTKGDIPAIINGCPDPPGVQKNVRLQSDGSLTCTPQIVPWDCVTNNPGESPPVLKGFDELIGQGNAPGNCAPNQWPDIPQTYGMDPREVIMIITAPNDLLNSNGTGDLPIRDFAVFYVTGWSSKASGFPQGGVKGCDNNDDPPPGATQGEIWGHWTSIAVPSGQGTSNGQLCEFTFGNCIAVLTR
jgi:hypothetical protein